MSKESAPLPWGMREHQPGSLKNLTEEKAKVFALGQQRKSRFQKVCIVHRFWSSGGCFSRRGGALQDKEEREAKKRKADEEAAKMYEQFVASFDTEDEENTKVRGRARLDSDGRLAHMRAIDQGPPDCGDGPVSKALATAVDVRARGFWGLVGVGERV
jgi:hypothetical protein